ncbi:MAG: tRNA (adenosine(37)-N6)-threonylcarbamoyltransferase complex dimerization subunit type 1 TsaB [Peptococcaceae bacterium]|nr:tRNA (adenosine(37)-N6)-threonylcarbamoyltransferase complex dimerization subunit type 1 TsaB [Peptococcaceae bacterium]
MKYLTIDTTTKITALALAEKGKLVGEGFLHTGKTHSERLIPMLDQLLTAAAWKLAELDFIAVVRGPGSFTGIRIGIATAQGLAQVLKIPVFGITSLDTLAWAGRGRSEEIVVLLDARKNEYYYARYRFLESRECVDGPKALSPQALLKVLTPMEQSFYFVGDAVPAAQKYLTEALGPRAIIPLEYQYLPRGAYAVFEAWQQWPKIAAQTRSALSSVEPFYIRMSEAEVNYRKKNSQQE